MPIANKRNDEQAELLTSDFVRRNDHIYIDALLPSALNAMGGIRDAWIFNRPTINPANVPTNASLIRGIAMNPTLAGVPAALTVPNTNSIYYRHGHQAKVRLGDVNGFYLFSSDEVNLRLTGIENHVIAADRGTTIFIAFYLPPTAVSPVGNEEFIAKWNDDGVNQRGWMLGWAPVAGVNRVRVWLSSNGIAAQSFTTTTLSLVAGNSYFIGFSFIASTSVTIFVNDQSQVLTQDDAAAAPPATIFANTALLCVGRRDITAAGGINAMTDCYYFFTGLVSMRWSQAIALSFYKLIQPVMLYNTDLGGT